MTEKVIDLDQFAPKGEALDLARYAPAPTPRGALGEIGAGLKRGALVGLPTMVGQALQYTSERGRPVYEAGRAIAESATARGEDPGLAARPDEHGAITNALAAGAEMVPSIVAPLAVAGGALAALPAMPAMASVGALAGGMAIPFALQAGQSTLEKGEKAGLPEDTAKTAARLNAGFTFGTQAALGMVGAGLFGRGAAALNPFVKREGADLAAATLRDLTGSAGVVKPFLKHLPVATAEAVGLGAAQMGGTAAIERAYGADTIEPLDAAIESVPAMLGLTAIMAPFGLAGRAVRANTLAKRAEALGAKETDPMIRAQLAEQYVAELQKVDPAAAAAFRENAKQAIVNRMPLEIDPGLFQEGAVRPVAPRGEKPLPDGVTPPALAAPPAQGALAGPGAAGLRDPGVVPPRADLEAQARERAALLQAEAQATAREQARAAEENRKALAQTHIQVVEELRAAGIEPQAAMSFAQFRDAMAKEAKKAGLKPDDLTPADYQAMWETHQQDVMAANFRRAQEYAFQLAEDGRKPPTQAGEPPRSALAAALEDALKQKQIDDAYRQRESEASLARQAELTRIQNETRGAELAAAAARGDVPEAAKTIPMKSDAIVTALRGVKAADQPMPPKLAKEVVEATQGKRTLENQLKALRELRDAKDSKTASYELLDKLYVQLGGDDGTSVSGKAETKGTDAQKAAGQGDGEKAQVGRGGRPKGTTDDRHTIGPPNEVGELLPYTRTLHEARNGPNGGIFGEKQWWQDLAWAVRNPNTKIGKELLENGKVTDEQIGQALARDERYQRADALLEEMRVKREERLREQLLAEAQPEGAKEILRAKDLVNIFGGDESDYVLDKKSPLAKEMAKGDTPAVLRVLRGGVQQAPDLLSQLQKVAQLPHEKALIAALQALGLKTRVVFADRMLGTEDAPKLGSYHDQKDVVLIGRGGANVETVLHELVHAATVGRIMNAVHSMELLNSGTLRMRDLSPDQRKAVESTMELLDLFEDAYGEGKDKQYGFTNPLEFVAEALSNKEFQTYLDSKPLDKSLWQRFVDTIRNLLGMRIDRTMFDRALRVSAELLSGERATADALQTMGFDKSPEGALRQTEFVLNKATKLADMPLSIKEGFTRAHLYAATLNHIKQVFKDVLPEPYRPALEEYTRAKDLGKVMVETRNREALEVSRIMSELGEKKAGLDTKLYRLMGESSRHNIFPDRSIDKQPWKAKEATPEKLRLFNELRAIYQSNPDLAKAYDAAYQFNKADYERMYATVVRNIARYSDMPANLWKAIDVTKGRSAQLEALEKWIFTNGNDEQRTALRGVLAQYREKEGGPYFHLGRSGDYFVRFTLKDTPEARAAYEKELGVAMTERVVGEADKHVFSRFETVGEWKAVTEKLNRLRAAGHLDAEMQAGKLEEMIGRLDSSSPAFIRGMLRNIEVDARLDSDEKAAAQNVLRRLAIEMLPETSASKAFAQRKGVAGYDVDMNRNFVKRAASSAYFVAHNATRPEVEDALSAIKQGVRAMQDASSPHYNNDRGLVAAALQRELKERQANDLLAARTPNIDVVSALSHSFYLAANPAFLLMKTTQPWQLTLPLLGARHGFVKSFAEMTKATAKALGIIKDAIGDGWKRDQWMGVIDPHIAVDRSRANAQEKIFLKALIDSGGVEFTQAHDIGRITQGENQGVSTTVKALNASLHYSEALDRMTAGLAAFNLEFKRTGSMEKATAFGIQAVKNTLYDYNMHNKGRMFGKQGIFGPYTPLLTQFAQYQFQTLELMGRLTMDAFGKLDANMTPAERTKAIAERAEARRALAGLMATTTVLAGTMGLPAVTVVAAAYNALFGTKDQPVDALADYRNFLADTFGKEAAEIIAHGGVRAVGSDLGTRLGFQDILPFSRMLADRRRLQDRFESGAMDMLGPAVGAAAGFAFGAQQMMQGRYMKGLEQMLPSGLRGVVKGIELERHGLTDIRGNQLPVKIDSWDVLQQLIFNSTPAKVAEQREAQRVVNTASMLIKERVQSLTENFAIAYERGDAEGLKQLTDQIVEFNKANPDYAIRDLAGILRRRALDRAVAEQTGVRGGVKQLPRIEQAGRFANTRGMP